jgi:phenylalanyl-tRNA synthetase beta chain
MPVVTLYWDELERMVGKDRQTILSKLPMLGCDIERVEDDHVDVEFFPNRPDLYSVEGVARALRGFLDIEHGQKRYSVSKSDFKIFVEKEVLDVRPHITGCVVKNLKMTDEVIRSLMQVQEDLHWTIGRNRRKMAIGVHDLSRVNFPLRYTAVREDFSFVPLDFDTEMTVGEILRKHPKGIEYGFILKDHSTFPMIIDSKNEAISFPPVINAEKTRVTEGTSNLFIDVTGFDDNVDKALNIVATMFSDRGGEILAVDVIYPDRTETTPNLNPKEMKVPMREVRELLGFEIKADEAILALRRMRFDANTYTDAKTAEPDADITEKKNLEDEYLIVEVPPYRADIMHPWDIIEDVAIGYGYDRILPEYPATNTLGLTHPWNEIRDSVKEIMIGTGFLEVITFTLTNEKVQYKYMRRDATPWKDFVPVQHPLTEEHTIIRTHLLPSLLEVLSLNKHHPMPQRLFEVGDVVIGGLNRLKVAAVSTHSRANFSEIRSVAQTLLKELGIEWEAENDEDRAFIPGRCAEILVNGKSIGKFGEMHPEVLEKFQIFTPVVGIEIDLSDIFDVGEVL